MGGGPWLSVGWRQGMPDPGDRGFERGAVFAGVLARTLRAAGYEPRRLEVHLARNAQGVLELHVRGEVPGMPLGDFESLARVTLHAVTLRRELAGDEDLALVVELRPSTTNGKVHAAAAEPWRRRRIVMPRIAIPDRVRGWAESFPVARLGTGLVLGLLLGVLGLPRVELALPTLPWQAQPTLTQVSELGPAAEDPVPTAFVRQSSSRVLAARPTVVPTLEETVVTPAPTPTLVPTLVPTVSPTSPPVLTAARYGPGVLFAERFATPLLDWPNDSRATAWFEAGAYHLYARDPGRFVAVGVPIAGPMGDGAISAQFHKVSGPAGGGYGFIVRDQGRSTALDSRSQSGRYLVLEVGDRGEVGVWLRDQTQWIDVISWHHHDAVRPDNEQNLLVVYTRGPALRFEVNGDVVADLAFDGLPTRGGVGVFVGGDLNEVALEWLRVEAF